MERLKKPFEPMTTLVIIYLGLVTVSIALYALIQIYVDDKATASNLLSWTATLFATIALLYTFNSWRDQKGSDVLSKLAEQSLYDLINLEKLQNNFYEKYTDKINNERFNNRIFSISNIYINEIQIFNENMEKVTNNLILIKIKTNDNNIIKLIRNINKSKEDITTLISKLNNYYIKNENIEDSFLDQHISEMKDLSYNIQVNILLIRSQLIKYIFHEKL